MATPDITSIFTPVQNAGKGVVRHEAPLSKLLETVTGDTVETAGRDLPRFNRLVGQTKIVVSSHFDETPCEGSASDTGDGASGSDGPTPSQGSDDLDDQTFLAGDAGTQLDATSVKLLAGIDRKLTAITDVLSETDDNLRKRLAAKGPAPLAKAASPACWRYRDTVHGPEALVQEKALMVFKINGRVSTLGGLIGSGRGSLKVLTYIEYSVNTFLNGTTGWKFGDKGQVDPTTGRTVLRATPGCYGTGERITGLPSCGSDSVTDTMKVRIQYKRIFIGEVGARLSTRAANVDLDASLVQLNESVFLGSASFTHKYGSAS